MTDDPDNAAPIRPCDLARILHDTLRSVEDVLRSLERGAQLPPDIAVEIGDARRFVACAHEEARQLVVATAASAQAGAWTEDLREAVPSVASRQSPLTGAPAARLRAVHDSLGPLKVAAATLALASAGRAPEAAILNLQWIKRWLLLADRPMARALAAVPATASGNGPAAAADDAEARDPEQDTGSRRAAPSRRRPRPRSPPGKRLL